MDDRGAWGWANEGLDGLPWRETIHAIAPFSAPLPTGEGGAPVVLHLSKECGGKNPAPMGRAALGVLRILPRSEIDNPL